MSEAASLFNPDNFGEGGFLDDKDVTVVSARVGTMSDTPFTEGKDGAFLILGFHADDADEDSVSKEYYRFGSLEKFSPSADKKRVVVQPNTKLLKSTKASMFFAALVAAGFPKKDLPADNSVDFLEGLRLHVNIVEMKEMEIDGKKSKPKCLVPTAILDTKKGAKAKPAAAAKTMTNGTGKAAEAPAAAADGDAVTVATENAIVQLIQDGGGQTFKRVLPTEVMKRITDKPLQVGAFKLVGKNDWLGDEARPWDFDAGSGTFSMNERTGERIASLG